MGNIISIARSISIIKRSFERYLSSVKNNEDDDITKNKAVLKSIELDVLIAETESELEYKKRIYAMERGPQVYYQIIRNGLVGLPDIIAKKVKDYLKADIDQFFLAFQNPFDLKALDLFMNSMKDFCLKKIICYDYMHLLYLFNCVIMRMGFNLSKICYIYCVFLFLFSFVLNPLITTNLKLL
jgi:hypothetical protein